MEQTYGLWDVVLDSVVSSLQVNVVSSLSFLQEILTKQSVGETGKSSPIRCTTGEFHRIDLLVGVERVDDETEEPVNLRLGGSLRLLHQP